jgi:hypothetical protein
MMNIQNIPPELIYILLFAGVALFQYLIKRFAKRPAPDAFEEKPLPQAEPIREDAPLPEIWGRPPVVPAAAPVLAPRVAQALAIPAPIPRNRSAARTLLGTKLDLQRTIAIMTILGPCRAQEPSDSR